MLVLGWALFRAQTQRQEFDSLPGAVGYQEGSTANPQLFRDAQDLLARGQVAQAEALYHEAVRREPSNPAGYIGLGTYRYFQGDYVGAEQHYQHALALDARSTMALRDGDPQQASAFYERALRISPD